MGKKLIALGSLFHWFRCEGGKKHRMARSDERNRAVAEVKDKRLELRRALDELAQARKEAGNGT